MGDQYKIAKDGRLFVKTAGSEDWVEIEPETVTEFKG